ncbi:MAG: hypothetical protein M1135_04325, partial [Candidatus Omnitrophica bacterium]|nr:hypothetical protein [Candidatus Omnitrophota bacterium]
MKKPLFFKSIVIYFSILFVLLLFLIPVVKKSIPIFIFLFLFLAIGLFILVFYSFSKTLHEIEDSIKKLGNGKFDTRVYLKPGNQFEFLSQSFNYMSHNIEEKILQITNEMQDVKNIIHSLEEPFVIIDEKDNIIVTNEQFENIISFSDVKNKKYWEVLRDIFFDNLIKEIRDKKEIETGKVYFDEKIFMCKGIFLSSSKTVAIIFYDITEKNSFEKIKKDFVANVSHELKTPLTAIKGYVETLKEETNEE